MLKLLKKKNSIVEPHDKILYDIRDEISAKYGIVLELDVISNIISSQSYFAFNLGIKNGLNVRFPRLGAFKVNTKAKKARDLFHIVLSECDGNKAIARKVIKELNKEDVL